MTTLITTLMVIAAIWLLCSYVASRPRGRQLTALANIAEGFQPNRLTYLADVAISTRYLLVKPGTTQAHVDICGVNDIPLGVATDEPGVGDGVSVTLLGVQAECCIGIASAAIAAGALLVPAANGKVRTLPVAAGTYYIVGRALKAAAGDNDSVEFVPCFPTQRVVT